MIEYKSRGGYFILGGLILDNIQESSDSVIMLFVGGRFPHHTNRKVRLEFDGFLLKTTKFQEGFSVTSAIHSNSIGFRGLSNLQQMKIDSQEWSQLLIVFENDDLQDKNEIICISKKFNCIEL